MSWDEPFGDRYEEWSAHMTADVDFYVDLARKTDGPLVELAVVVELVKLMCHQQRLRKVSVVYAPVYTSVIEFIIKRTLVVKV